MKILNWNYRKLGNQIVVDVLSHLVRERASKIFFLMETKQSEAEMRRIQVELPYRYVFVVPSIQWSAGLSLLGKEEIDLLFQTCTLHHRDALIIDDSANLWRLTSFYGWPDEQQKHESWQLLKHLHTKHSIPWLCFGDFNEILQSKEKQGHLPKLLAPMQQFQAALLHCGLVDVGFKGNLFT